MNAPFSAVLVFGPPGSGKGTQAQFLSRLTGHYHLSSGDIFRNLPPTSEFYQLQREYLDRGLLIPDETAVDIWKEHVAGLVKSGQFQPTRQLLLTDGMPRTPKQLELLAGALRVLAVLSLEIDDERHLIERLEKRAQAQKRADDQNAKTLARRISIYKSESKEILHSFPANSVISIAADQRPFEVLRDILVRASRWLRFPDL